MAHVQYKRFTFTKIRRGHEVEIETAKPGSRYQEVTPSTYARFVALANDGQYDVEILNGHNGISWAISRWTHTPPAKSQTASERAWAAHLEMCEMGDKDDLLGTHNAYEQAVKADRAAGINPHPTPRYEPQPEPDRSRALLDTPRQYQIEMDGEILWA